MSHPKCHAPGCTKLAQNRNDGMCRRCWIAAGQPAHTPKIHVADPQCTVANEIERCRRPWYSGKYCKMHYWRVINHGKPGPVRPTRAPKGAARAHVEALAPTMARGACYTEWPFRTKSKGRPAVRIDGAMVPSVRYAWYLIHGKWPEQQLNHVCHDELCWNPHHVYEGTQAQNVYDMDEAGRRVTFSAHGTLSGMAKLTEALVLEIRRRYAEGGISHAALGRQHGVCEATIQHVVTRRTWRHI